MINFVAWVLAIGIGFIFLNVAIAASTILIVLAPIAIGYKKGLIYGIISAIVLYLLYPVAICISSTHSQFCLLGNYHTLPIEAITKVVIVISNVCITLEN